MVTNELTGSAIEVREVTLPGIGKKYVMPLRAGGNLAIVVRPDGERQMYHFREQEDRPCDVVKVDKEEAQQVANLLGQPLVGAPDLERLKLVLGGLEIEWIELGVDSTLIGTTVGASALRTKTGVSIVAIMRGEQAIPNPRVDTVFEAGDTILIIGSNPEIEAARDAVRSRA